MKKIVKMLVRGLLLVLVLVAISLLVFLHEKMDSLQSKVGELNAQLLYIQDTNSVVLSNLGQMEENIEASLAEESSLIEDYSIAFAGCDFSLGTYEVEITILPKEYTKNTLVTVYFGTKSYNLELQGLAYKGMASLSLQNDYDGNVTVLIANGEKRATEILNNYIGFPTLAKKSLKASLTNPVISFDQETLSVDGIVNYELDGQKLFTYESFELLVEVDDTLVYDYDLVQEAGGLIETEETDPMEEDISLLPEEMSDVELPMEEEVIEEEITDSESLTEYLNGISGAHDLQFQLNRNSLEHVKIYLWAVTKEGYQFSFLLYDGNPIEENDASYMEHFDMLDSQNATWKIQ